jgi:DNA-binding MarR family transcriptional regulator
MPDFSDFPGYRDTVLFPLELAFKILAQRADRWLVEHVGCTRRELWVLLCVDDSRMSQQQIGDILRIHQNVMVKILDAMETRGLVKRVQNPKDRREKIVETTNKGRRARTEFRDEREAAMTYIFAPLGIPQREQLRVWSLALLEHAGAGKVNLDDTDS